MPKAKGSTAHKAKSQPATTGHRPPPATPAWPQFKPALPVTDLVPEPLEACPDKVVLIQNFWPRSLCNAYIAFLKDLPLTTTPGRPKRGEALRVNDRFQIDDPVFASRLWLQTGLREALMQDEDLAPLWGGDIAGLNSNIRIYRYSKGQYFDAHYDDANNVSVPSDPADLTSPSIPCRTTWTLLLYLTTSSADGPGSSSGCAGGETVFFPHDRRSPSEEIAVPPQTGLLLLHKHGDDCMLVRKMWNPLPFIFARHALSLPLFFPSCFGPAWVPAPVLTARHGLRAEAKISTCFPSKSRPETVPGRPRKPCWGG